MKIMGKNRMIIIKCIEKIGWIMTKISPCCEARYKPSLIKWRSSSTCSHGLDPAATCRADFRVFSTMEGSYIRYLSTVNRKSCQGLKIKPNHCKFCHMSFFAWGFKHLGWHYKLFKAASERRREIVSLQHLSLYRTSPPYNQGQTGRVFQLRVGSGLGIEKIFRVGYRVFLSNTKSIGYFRLLKS